MTFTELVQEICAHLNLPTTGEAATRIGRTLNRHYALVTSSIGLVVARRTTVSANTSLGSSTITFSGIEKIERVFDDTSGTIRILDEVTFDQLRQLEVGTGDPTRYAIERMGANTVTIRLDVLPQSEKTLKADGHETAATLSGAQTPAFPASYHTILVERVLAEEERKKGNIAAAREAESAANQMLSDLRMWIAKSAMEIRQGGAKKATSLSSSGGAGGSAPSGGTSWTQTGLITFDRDPAAPFAVSPGSAVVPNLIVETAQSADHLADVASDRLIGRDTAGAGVSEELTVGGGIEFTGSGGIQITAFTGDVTKAAGGTAQTIANDAVTFAKLQNIATDRLIGRDTAASGDPEEISVGGGLEFTGSGAIQRSALTGDVTAAAGSNSTSIATDAVTYAKMQNVSAASRLLGRGSAAGAGDPEEIAIGSGLSLSGTTVSALITQAIRQIVTATGSGNFSTSSATLVDVTNAAVTLTTGASATVLVIATIPVRIGSGNALFDWKIDGVDDGNVQGVISSTSDTTLTIFRLATGLSAASHTFQLRVRSSAGGTINIDMNAVATGKFAAIEWR